MKNQRLSSIIASFIIAALIGLVCAPITYADETPEQLAEKAANSWLALIDNGKFADSWDQSASAFRDAVSKEKWIESIEGVRKPLGKMKTRHLKAAKFTTNLPDAPKGSYVVIQYQTDFLNKTVIETVVPMLDKDGIWRISGYFVKPVAPKNQSVQLKMLTRVPAASE